MIDMVDYFEFMNLVDSGEFDFLYKYGPLLLVDCSLVHLDA